MGKGRKVFRANFSDTCNSSSRVDLVPRCIRLLVVNKHPLARQGLAVLLNQQVDFRVVGEVATFLECCDSVAQHEPEVVVFEFQVGDSSIAETVRNLSDVYPELPVVVLAEQEHGSDIVDAIRLGVQSCLLKNTAIETLFRAIRIASEGGSFMDPALRLTLATVPASALQSTEPASQNLRLTERETKILEFLAEGCTNDEIAKSVFICKSTVKFHLRNIFQKLGVTNRTMAVKVAAEKRLLQQPWCSTD